MACVFTARVLIPFCRVFSYRLLSSQKLFVALCYHDFGFFFGKCLVTLHSTKKCVKVFLFNFKNLKVNNNGRLKQCWFLINKVGASKNELSHVAEVRDQV